MLYYCTIIVQKHYKMRTIEITTTEFRQNQKKYLDEVAQGVQIILYRGKELFRISSIDKKTLFDEETQRQIEQGRKEWQEGKCVRCANSNELHSFLESL